MVLTPLDESGRIDDSVLRTAVPGEVDLLFVDSPNGTLARARLLAQLLEHVRPRRLVIHDARRDLAALAEVVAGHDYLVEASLSSRRGMTMLRWTDAPAMETIVDSEPRPLMDMSADITLANSVADMCDASGRCVVEVVVRNTSQQIWPHAGALPVRLSYHVTVGDDMVVFDGIRTSLPCDVAPGDELKLPVTVQLPDTVWVAEVSITQVQDGVAWFDALDPTQRPWCV